MIWTEMPRLPVVTAKSLENIISNDRALVKMNINAAEILDLSFLQRLEEERKTKGNYQKLGAAQSHLLGPVGEICIFEDFGFK
jgi:stalled ribosome alternative rescue factor ArfA